MARKTATIVITAEGRDKGRTYVITEMAAAQAEKWATRALLALGQSGVEIPEDVAQQGLGGVATLGLRAFTGVPWHLAEPLLDEMMRCVAFMPDAARPMVTRPLLEDDIEEIATRVRLREEVLSLHLGFSLSAYTSKLKQALTLAEPTPITAISPPALAS